MSGYDDLFSELQQRVAAPPQPVRPNTDRIEQAKTKQREVIAARIEDRSKKITVGAWSVYRHDENNVALQKGDGEPLWYPDFVSALIGMFRRLIEPKQKADLVVHLKQIKTAEEQIVKAVLGVSL